MNRGGVRALLILQVVVMGLAAPVARWSPVAASHHREAPLITIELEADITDVYSFVSPDGSSVSIIAQSALVHSPVLPFEFDQADSIVAFQVDPVPGGGPQTIPFEIPHQRYVSSQPVTVGYGSGGTEQFDVVVSESSVPSSGTLSLSPAGTGGGTFSLSADIVYRFLFTSRTNGREVVVDMAEEEIPAFQVSGSGNYSYGCPSGYLVKPGATPDLCLGHDPATGVVSDVLAVSENGNFSWTFRPAPAATTTLIAPNAGWDPYDLVNGNLNLSLVPLPSDFFGTGSELLSSLVPLTGVPDSSGTFPNSDVVIERTEGIAIADGESAITPLIVRRFRAETTVEVQNTDGTIDVWSLHVSESSSAPSGGSATIFRSDAYGGFFSQSIDFWLTLEFVSPSGGELRYFDFWANGLGPVSTEASSGWSHDCPDRFQRYGLTTDFCPGTNAATGDTFPISVGDFQNFPDVVLSAQLERTPAVAAPTNPPEVDAGGPYVATEGENLALEGDCGSSSQDEEDVRCLWDLDRDGEFGGEDDATGSGPVVDADDFGVGEHLVAVSSCWLSEPSVCATDDTTIIVLPRIVISGPDRGTFGESLVFRAEPGRVEPFVRFNWDLDGDGEHDDASGPEVTVSTFEMDLGARSISSMVCVTVDGEDFCNTATSIFTVAPSADPGGPYIADEDQPVSFSASSPVLVTYEWDFDASDGLAFTPPTEPATSNSTNETYENPGEFTVTLLVCDPDDPTNCTTVETTVAVRPLVEIIGPDEVVRGELSTFSVDCSSGFAPDGPCDSAAIRWYHQGIELPEWAGVTSIAVDTSSWSTGDNTISVDACSTDGVCNSDDRVVNVSAPNNPPVFDVVPELTVAEGAILDAVVVALDPEGGSVSYTWDDVPDFLTLELGPDGGLFISGIPQTGHAGDYSLMITAADDADPPAQTTVVLRIHVLPATDAGGPYPVIQGGTTIVAATGPADREYDWDLDNDGTYETHGQTATFNSTGLNLGTYPIDVRVCLSEGFACGFDDAVVIVEGPAVESYDELEALVRAHVANRIVEGLLIGTLNLAEYFDEELGLDEAAVRLLRAFIALVRSATPRWIDPSASDELIGFAQELIDGIIGVQF